MSRPAAAGSCFNPRPRAGGDRGGSSRYTSTDRFQSAPPRGGRRRRRRPTSSGSSFNPRPRAGGDLRASGEQFLRVEEFQSAPPRGGRPGVVGVADGGTCVSIRAPARGATVEGAGSLAGDLVSIRAPARGATQGCGDFCGVGWFQSAPPRGGRHGSPRGPGPWLPVSIRAPARGATGCARDRDLVEDVSIRAPARGATRTCQRTRTRTQFQSAPPRGGRPH